MKTTTTYLNELSITYNKKLFSNTSINNSNTTERLIREIYEQTSSEIELKEYFFIILLNRANEVIGYHKLSEGGICATLVDIRIAFATALKSLAVGMIMVHNHPSGNLKPSEQDLKLTRDFKAAGELLEVKVIDHIILTSDSYYSFIDEGKM
jgi:DNA repair protein RadC